MPVFLRHQTVETKVIAFGGQYPVKLKVILDNKTSRDLLPTMKRKIQIEFTNFRVYLCDVELFKDRKQKQERKQM